MPDPSDDMLMALADDQLRGPEAEALRARIGADAGLAARFAVFTESRAALQAAFDPGDTPEQLIAAIRGAEPEPAPRAEKVVAFPDRRGLWPKAALALAASLVLVVGMGSFLAGRSLGPGGVAEDPALRAATGLANLATGAVTDLPGGGTARALGSYLADPGLCRLIEIELPDVMAERAVVCRDSANGWAVVAAVAAGQGEAYIPASDAAGALIDQVLDDLGAGPALTHSDEAAALAP